MVVESVELRQRAPLPEHERVRRRGAFVIHRERGQAVRGRALGDELHLARRRVEGMRRVGDVRDAQRMDAARGPDIGDGRVTRRLMIEDDVDHGLVGGPREEVVHAETPRQLPQDPRHRAGLARRLEDLRHQVEMRVRALHAELLEPRRRGQEDVGTLPGRIAHEEVVDGHEIAAPQSLADAPRVGERGHHVGAPQQHDADAPAL